MERIVNDFALAEEAVASNAKVGRETDFSKSDDPARDNHLQPVRPRQGISINTANCTRDYPCVQPVVYSLDVLTPVINLHQREYWLPDTSSKPGRRLAIFTWVAILAGWLLTTVVLAGFTNAIKRE